MKTIEVAFPDDLCDWMSNTDLLTAVLGAISETPLPQDPKLGESLEHHSGFRIYLTLTAYCYGRGFDSPDEIERAFEEDSMARYIFFNRRPPLEEMRRLRKLHRPVLRQVIAKTLKSAFQFRASFEPIWGHGNQVTQAFDSLVEAYSQAEANLRIDRAALHETASLDL